MKYLKILLTMLLLLGCMSATTVTVSSPATGSTLSSPVEIKASASSWRSCCGWYIYVDSQAVWHSTANTSSIDVKVPLTQGFHNVMVRAWDSAGSYGSGYLALTVAPTYTAVTLLSPSSGTQVNPVHVAAQGVSQNGISGWVVYVDNNNAYKVDNYLNNLNVDLVIAPGTHNLFVRAWDRTNHMYGSSPTVSITIQQPLPVINAFTATSALVTSGDPVTLSWATTDATSLTLSGVGDVTGKTSYVVNPTQNTTYTLTASNGTTSATSSIDITVTPLPIPPPDAVVFNHIEDASGWGTTSAEAGGHNTTTDFWMKQFQATPSMDGSSMEIHVGGMPDTAGLFYHKVNSSYGQFNYASHFLWDYWVYVDSASMSNVWTLEYDLYQVVGGYEYMVGTHCKFGSGAGDYWYGWNQLNPKWIQTPIPCTHAAFTPDTWHHIQWYFERVPGSTNFKYVTLVFDNVPYTMNLIEPAGPTNWSEVLGVQWQIDTNGNGGSANEWIDKAILTLW